MTIDLATLKLTPRQATRNIMIAGLPGTGKTVLLWFMLESLVKHVVEENTRIYLTDPKKENIPILAGLFPAWLPFWITHPMDERAVALAFCKMFKTKGDAERLVKMLIQEDKGTNEPYWINITRLLLISLAHYFQTKIPGSWSFHDLVETACDATSLENKLSKFPPSRSLVQSTFKDKEHKGKVLSSLGSYIAQYRVLAQNWSECSDEISLDNILASQCVLLLGHDEKYPTQFSKLNSLIVNELAAEILSVRDKSKWHYLILDEFALLKGFADIRELLLKGRDSNVSVVLTFQDPSSLISVLGKEKFTELTSMCQFKVFLKLGPDAADWASKQAGECEVKENNQLKRRPIILPDDFINLDLAGDFIEGFIVSPYGSPAYFKMPYRERLQAILNKAKGSGFVSRTAKLP